MSPSFDMTAPTPGDMAGVCDPACGGATPHCNARGLCVACIGDGDCKGGQRCTPLGDVTVCVPGCALDQNCPQGMACCGGLCTDKQTDRNNCGACGTACAAEHAEAACVAGACQSGNCSTGFGDCNHDAVDGCEANLTTDAANCGGCGTACQFPRARAGCSHSCYIAACDFGYADCDNDPKNGCELPVLVDTQNCGGCGNVCTDPRNATATCVFGACALGSCDAGYADCNGDLTDGCESTLSTDAKNCGACGNACAGGQVCINGDCTCPKCKFPNVKTHCDQNGMCTFDACLTGFADCNKDFVADGCEVNTLYDAANCGACGSACGGLTPFCHGGVCSDVPPADIYTGSFVSNTDAPDECTKWADYLSGTLSAKRVYTSVTMSGSQDMVGVTCQGAEANTLCQALHTNDIKGNVTQVQCNGRGWAVGVGFGSAVEITTSAGMGPFVGACENPGYTVRPCGILGRKAFGWWGGINSNTCGGPDQTLTIRCGL